MPKSIPSDILIVIRSCVCRSPRSKVHWKRKSCQSSAHSSTDIFVLIPHFLKISKGRSFPPLVGKPTPRHLPMPQLPGPHRTLPFCHAPQPVSPPGAVDHRCLEPLLRNLLALAPELKCFGIQDRNTVESDIKLPKIFRGRMRRLMSLVTLVPHKLS